MGVRSRALFLGLVVSAIAVEAKQHAYQTSNLFEAVKAGNKRDVKKYLKSGCEINVLDQSNKTALDYAIELNKVNIALLLLKKKAIVTSEHNLNMLKIIIKKRIRKFQFLGFFFGVIGLFFYWVPFGAAFASMMAFATSNVVMSTASDLFLVTVYASAPVIFVLGLYYLPYKLIQTAYRWNKIYKYYDYEGRFNTVLIR